MSHKAILVKYLPFTNHKPARMKAVVDSRLSFSVSVAGYSCDEEAALAAAKAIAESLCWRGKYIKGTLPNGDTVFVEEDTLDTFGSFTVR